MAPKFERFVMGASLAAATAFHAPEAHAEDTTAEMTEMSRRLDTRFEEEHQGYDFQVNAHSYDSVFKGASNGNGYAMVDWQYKPHTETRWHTGKPMKISRELPDAERDDEAALNVDEELRMYEADQAAQHEVVEDYRISGAAQDLIVQMGGDPFSRATTIKGQPYLELKVSDAKSSGFLQLDATTDSADIHLVQEGNKKFLEVTLVSTKDGEIVNEVARWSEDGQLIGARKGTSW